MAKLENRKKDILIRLRRIEGQIRGLQRMVEEGIPCPEILTQVAAATAAIKRVGAVMVQAYLQECLDRSENGPVAKRGETLKDLHHAISHYLDQA